MFKGKINGRSTLAFSFSWFDSLQRASTHTSEKLRQRSYESCSFLLIPSLLLKGNIGRVGVRIVFNRLAHEHPTGNIGPSTSCASAVITIMITLSVVSGMDHERSFGSCGRCTTWWHTNVN